MWGKIGIIRTGSQLDEAAQVLAARQDAAPKPIDRSSYELNHLLTVGRLMAEAALLRKESRGAHYRMDCVDTLPVWVRRIVFQKY